MFPVECFKSDDPTRIEAVKYYILLNKKLLQELSKVEYEKFCDFLRTEGKTVLREMEKDGSDAKLYELLADIEKKLPYVKRLKEFTSLDDKVKWLHKEFAKIKVKKDFENITDNIVSLKRQRILAGQYDEMQRVITKYRDALDSYQYIKAVGNNSTEFNRLRAKGASLGKEEFLNGFISTAEELKEELKELRADAFNKMIDYYVAELQSLLEQDASLLYDK